MSLLTANLTRLGTRFPKAAAALADQIPSGTIRYTVARDGNSVAEECFDERYYPLHSLIAPAREGERTLKSIGNAGFLVALGLGSGWHLEGVVAEGRRRLLLVVDGADRLLSLLSGRDFSGLLGYPGLELLLNPGPEDLTRTIIDAYLPGLHGGFALLPLGPLAARRRERFELLTSAAAAAVEAVKQDFSVQARFGLRWTRNILTNLSFYETRGREPTPLSRRTLAQATESANEGHSPRALIIGAGPTLREYLAEIRSRAGKELILSTDTALPVLLEAGITPNAVVSIDCQFYTLLHREHPRAGRIPWILSPSAPPTLVRELDHPLFFAGGNPLERAVSPLLGLPGLDTDGGNVLQTCFSAAEQLGIESIHLYGADYANPRGLPYCVGTYVDRWFRYRGCRTRPFDSSLLQFVFASREENDSTQYDPDYPAPRLTRYRRSMEEYLGCKPFQLETRGGAVLRPARNAATTAIREEKNEAAASAARATRTRPSVIDSLRIRANSEEAGSLRLIYPLLAYLRHREDSDGAVKPQDAIARARKYFIELLDAGRE